MYSIYKQNTRTHTHTQAKGKGRLIFEERISRKLYGPESREALLKRPIRLQPCCRARYRRNGWANLQARIWHTNVEGVRELNSEKGTHKKDK